MAASYPDTGLVVDSSIQISERIFIYDWRIPHNVLVAMRISGATDSFAILYTNFSQKHYSLRAPSHLLPVARTHIP
eukprot:11109739-Heterocapsa_arctica.AAC.1